MRRRNKYIKLSLKSVCGLLHRVSLHGCQSGLTDFVSILPAVSQSQQNPLLNLVQDYFFGLKNSEDHSEEYFLCGVLAGLREDEWKANECDDGLREFGKPRKSGCERVDIIMRKGECAFELYGIKNIKFQFLVLAFNEL